MSKPNKKYTHDLKIMSLLGFRTGSGFWSWSELYWHFIASSSIRCAKVLPTPTPYMRTSHAHFSSLSLGVKWRQTGWWRCVLLVPRNFPVHKTQLKIHPRFENYEFLLGLGWPALVLVLGSELYWHFIASGLWLFPLPHHATKMVLGFSRMYSQTRNTIIAYTISSGDIEIEHRDV